VQNVLRQIPGVEVVGVAKTGSQAVSISQQLDPDLITLDVQMPEMDGIEVLRSLRRSKSRTKAVMLSSLTANGAQTTTDALFEGAFDFIHKPAGLDANANRALLLQELSEKIEAFRNSTAARPETRAALTSAGRIISRESDGLKSIHPPSDAPFALVVIGCSTGGPAALRELLPALPGQLPTPIVIAQHMPANYTHSLAARLNEQSALTILEGATGTVLAPCHAYIAPGGMQMGLIRRGGRMELAVNDDPPEHGCRPAVDYLLRSAVAACQGKILAVIMTGMGRDGVAGCRLVRQQGGIVIAQHPIGCTVFGMPKAVIDEQLAHEVVPLDKLAATITGTLRNPTVPVS
jgi:two-component system chemotaxis response regulator CheB